VNFDPFFLDPVDPGENPSVYPEWKGTSVVDFDRAGHAGQVLVPREHPHDFVEKTCGSSAVNMPGRAFGRRLESDSREQKVPAFFLTPV
jgi:hypothetical protein